MNPQEAALSLPEPNEIVGEGRFELRKELGEGGMSSVFIARDRLLDLDVALKLLTPRYVGRPEREQRLVNEAEYLRRLQGHPNVVSLIDSGRLRDRSGWPWLSTELLEGETLDWLLVRGGLGLPRILEIARQLATALQACHEAGVVHRDVTPSNVFILADGTVKLFDFSHGADLRAPQLAVGAPERLTGIFETPGTVGYIGPEQAANATPDAGMDTFGFGVLLFELITGRNPYQQFDDRDAFIEAQREGSLEPPRLHAWAYDAPEELAELVHDCTGRDQVRPTMAGIVERLEALDGAGGREVTEAVDAPAIIARARQPQARADPDVIGDWNRPSSQQPAAQVGPLAPVADPPAGGDAVVPDESTEVLAFARPPQVRREAPASTVDRGPVVQAEVPLVGPPVGQARPATPVHERAEEVPAPLGPKRGGLALGVVGAVALLAAAAWFWTTREGAVDERSYASEHAEEQEADTNDPRPSANDGQVEMSVPETGDESETGESEVEPETEPEMKPEPEPRPNPKPERKPKPKPEAPAAEDCDGVEKQARAASKGRKWRQVVELTGRKACWSSNDERTRLLVTALVSMGKVDRCVRAGAGSKDPKVLSIVDTCEKLAARGKPAPSSP